MMRTIPAGLLEHMVGRLVDEFDPERVILFGSHAWGTPDQDSDIDLMVILASSDLDPGKGMTRALGCLGPVGVSKDVIVKTASEFERYAHLRTSLEYQVKTRGIVIHERPSPAPVISAPEGRHRVARGLRPWFGTDKKIDQPRRGRHRVAMSPLRGCNILLATEPGACAPGYTMPPLRG